jgi:hypothetical protein
MYHMTLFVENEQGERLISVSVQLLGNNVRVSPRSFIVL